MVNLNAYEARREALRERFLSGEQPAPDSVLTGGVNHLALISSDLDATIRFYTGVLKMRLTRIITNHDDPTSTHIFLDMGGGNLLAFFDFPEHGPAPTVRGIGSMHHVALKAEPEQFQARVFALKEQEISFSLHGSENEGSVYMRDPDNILVEVTTG